MMVMQKKPEPKRNCYLGRRPTGHKERKAQLLLLVVQSPMMAVAAAHRPSYFVIGSPCYSFNPQLTCLGFSGQINNFLFSNVGSRRRRRVQFQQRLRPCTTACSASSDKPPPSSEIRSLSVPLYCFNCFCY